jgi:hypothetical protein
MSLKEVIVHTEVQLERYDSPESSITLEAKHGVRGHGQRSEQKAASIRS